MVPRIGDEFRRRTGRRNLEWREKEANRTHEESFDQFCLVLEVPTSDKFIEQSRDYLRVRIEAPVHFGLDSRSLALRNNVVDELSGCRDRIPFHSSHTLHNVF